MINLYFLTRDMINKESKIRNNSYKIIKNIYTILLSPSLRTKNIFKKWEDDFEYLYGKIDKNLSSNGKFNIVNLLNLYGISLYNNINVKYLFFSIQTYFSILIKYILALALYKDNKFNLEYEEILTGEFIKKFGIINFDDNIYIWPLFEISNGFNLIIENIINDIMRYDSKNILIEYSHEDRYDYLKIIYEEIIPKEFRHALGEYYTPDWLVENIFNEISKYNKNKLLESTILDPTCGSGTFLIKLIKEKIKSKSSIENIISSIYGFEINPLAVLTAKINYILSISDLLNNNKNIIIPIYQVDLLNKNDEFLKKFDIIVGNPPWVNWEYISDKYKYSSQKLWKYYNIFNSTGIDLSFAKEDISVLITYITIDKFLKDSGLIVFIIKKSIFKSENNGIGFRNFSINNSTPFKIIKVDDISNIKVFENINNETAIFFAIKGEKTTFPIKYNTWKKNTNKLNINKLSLLRDVLYQIKISEGYAINSVENSISSIWITLDYNDKLDPKKYLGTNTYKARTGVFTGGANAVYWLQITGTNKSLIEICNIVDRAKRKVKKIKSLIESNHIYPLLKGSNIKKWNISYDNYILCPHSIDTKMWPIPQLELQQLYPYTLKYLQYFKDDLDKRNGFAGWEKDIQKNEFHSILRIGEYTFSKFKVVWKYISTEFICAVISHVHDKYLGDKMILPNDKVMYISTDIEEEAYYLCGILSSTPISFCIKSYMNPTSISTHILNKIKINKFDPKNNYHLEISNLCKLGHKSLNQDIYQKEIDSIIYKLYN